MENLQTRATELGISYKELLKYPKLADTIVSHDECNALIEDMRRYLLDISSRMEIHSYRTGKHEDRKPCFTAIADEPLPFFETFEAYDIYMTELEHKTLNISGGLGAWIYAATRSKIIRIRSHYPHLERLRNEKIELFSKVSRDKNIGQSHVEGEKSAILNKEQTNLVVDTAPKSLLHFIELDEEMSSRYNDVEVLTIVSYKNRILYRYCLKEVSNGYRTNVAIIDLNTRLSREELELSQSMVSANIVLLNQPYGIDILLMDNDAYCVDDFKELSVSIATALMNKTGKIISICFAKTLKAKHVSLSD